MQRYGELKITFYSYDLAAMLLVTKQAQESMMVGDELPLLGKICRRRNEKLLTALPIYLRPFHFASLRSSSKRQPEVS